jgi:hypothetical protein
MKLSRRNSLRLLQLQEDYKSFASFLNSEITDKIASVSGSCPSEVIVKIIWTIVKNNTQSVVNTFLHLVRSFSEKRLSAACKRVSFYGLASIDTIRTVLIEKLDMLPLDPKTDIYGQPDLF